MPIRRFERLVLARLKRGRGVLENYCGGGVYI